MNDTYRGDSPAKKFARLRFWERSKELLGERWEAAKFVVLAGREGGDVSVLLGLEARPDQIVAVEREPDAAAAFVARWPGVRCEQREVADVVERERPDVALLDFCAPLCAESLKASELSASFIRRGGILGVNLLKGRESHAVAACSKAAFSNRHSRRVDRARQRDARHALANAYFAGSSKDALEAGRSNYDDPSGARVQVLTVRINALLKVRRSRLDRRGPYFVKVEEIISYKGSSPMVMALIRIGDHASPYNKDCNRIVRATEIDVRNHALQLGSNAHLLLNLERATVTAWHAHQTRGTYDAA